MTVLIVDDEEIIRSLATRILQRDGYDVITASSGNQGLQIYAQQPDQIDLVLMDMTMPGISGVETLRRIREIKPELPCIISSGHVADQQHISDDLMNNTFFLQKPYRLDKLSKLVDEILTREPSQNS